MAKADREWCGYMAEVYIGLGSNMGDRENYLRRAVAELASRPGVRLLTCSSIYETSPVSPVEQGNYLNMVARIACDLVPLELLTVCEEIEELLGRKETPYVPLGPRPIDLDILLWEDLIYQSPELTIPHPYLTVRRFVLIPLLEIDKNLRLPGGDLLKSYLSELSLDDKVEFYANYDWVSIAHAP
ncbi:2-amino-4-hydroxy-6-hydroxymethyldihydropteridine diphosphokinase [Candidatus Hakubella thermalkaliphila]|uniref:2-amino-4-hydroxy-6-hydroxymethyldihydropteridine diphosphokinase n=3 Tax=Candidatus Hakubella thermalkaliphila TaxID=2754717 RepID=A0A6V8Q0X1_9ACTN|nr:2-amino-4-hydroxy-6-hydroxymethyldihydropteridine diphosphokinase [Candidatus Hakubella thermalkaliphila]GFP19460.1 2-amino-4-hydroxy-6-hydroxymethyldihydropteridine diphosphokinase [Candidatus Hakubella thermalkaliphila]GFP22560.1 2-amino-4-hydroxy-6-hydroxymethyldihydropteridine diphosphokinase [Candidatus Hakubella thermalkaliphila]GFP36581.1 2-amino-4-hydroxy-6-hydroxymethyldihydropteridine diphosphokinase [Candidatus Hakubella thermalkaliphila]GFP38480.1 2-amino-4-hydroxy-6-hydroxymethy